MATLTYVYADSTAVLGPLATYAEPHCYDLCAIHAGRLTVPLGWNVLRLELPGEAPLDPEDIYALADALRQPAPAREAAPVEDLAGPRTSPDPLEPPPGGELTRKHLRILRDQS